LILSAIGRWSISAMVLRPFYIDVDWRSKKVAKTGKTGNTEKARLKRTCLGVA